MSNPCYSYCVRVPASSGVYSVTLGKSETYKEAIKGKFHHITVPVRCLLVRACGAEGLAGGSGSGQSCCNLAGLAVPARPLQILEFKYCTSTYS